MSEEPVEVWSGEAPGPRRVGTLRPSFQGLRTLASSSFEYDSDFLRDGWQVSPDLPLRPGRTYTADNQTLPGAFSDAAPDDWGQKLIRADHALRRQRDASLPARLGEFDYLLGVADHTRIGALRFRTGDSWSSSESGVANLHDLDRILAAAARYEDDEATDEDIAYLGDVATSPGGARPKANVVTAAGTLAIAKLPHSKDGRFDVERWEAVALTLASDAGLRVPRWSLVPPGAGRAVLLSERFDRDADGNRLGYMSARTALELGAHDDGTRLTYEDLSDVIDHWSAAPADDLREMFGRIALSVLVNNVDDHWRNHAFLHTPAGWRLSPMFDVNPSRQRGVIDSRAISPADDPRSRDLRNLLDIADAFRLRRADAEGDLQRVAGAVAGWDRVASGLGIPADEREAMRVAFGSAQLDWALGL
ncbi:type II toxin-antitoxin system HipA family toxin [Curtobacterium pusillum]|uniref:type II toxin-antitoxin system HipA family toxin n=1 Tax=Curtobacterium pusillum TaxID=69373 RepID=UPI0011A55BA5|nr:type II toxin-antitoxin system HipA family toxin [Curtobacterium pusillum]